MTRKYIYLAGPITGLSYVAATDWREDPALLQHLTRHGWTALSPMRGKDYLKGARELAGVFDEGRAAVERDCFDIRRSQAILVNLLGAERVSIGTVAEMGYARALDKHIVTVMDHDDAEIATRGAQVGYNPPRIHNPHAHIFPIHFSSIILPDIPTALDWVANL